MGTFKIPAKSDMTLTDAGQIVPDQSTAAIIIHHPESRIFYTLNLFTACCIIS